MKSGSKGDKNGTKKDDYKGTKGTGKGSGSAKGGKGK